ncbi:MAG: hypothetical protein GX295_11780 [Syntrophomonadaceae bacterium]|nr:hypothetical protein [Syntrophomonadaceae bacterium]
MSNYYLIPGFLGISMIVMLLSVVIVWFFTRQADFLKQRFNQIKDRLTQNIQYKEMAVKEEVNLKPLLLGLLVGLVLGLLLGWGTEYLWLSLSICGSIGIIASLFIKKSLDDLERLKKIKELAILHESISFYGDAGYTIQQSLQMASTLTPMLRPAIFRCLANWPYGSIQALYKFAEGVNLPEAEILASILAHAEESGIKFGQNAMEEEAHALESLRHSLVEIKIMSKPMYFAAYRALPLFSVSSIVVGALIYRVIIMLKSLAGV